MYAVLLAIYIALILVRPMDWWPPVLGWQLVNIAGAATCLVGFPVVIARLKDTWQHIPQIKAAIALLIGVTLSWAPHVWLGGMQMAFQDIGKVVIFFTLILILISNMRDYRILVWTFLVCIAWMAINAILQHHQGRGFGDSEPLWRIRNRLTGEGVYQARGVGTFEDPNDLCLVLVVGISLFYAHFRLEPNPVWKAIALAGLALCGYGAWCTNSRGGIVAIFGMLAAYAIVRTKGLRRYLMAATAISIVTVLAPSRFGGRMVGRDRSILWGDGLAMFKANPLFGVGYGDFTSYSSEHLVAHNTYIHTLAELGIVGYLPLFLLLYLTMIQLRRTIQCKDLISKQDYFLLTGLFSALSGYFVGMYFLSRQYQHILYLMLSLAITAVHVIASRYGLTEKIFGQTRRDVRYGLLWGAASILVLWSSTRFVNAIS